MTTEGIKIPRPPDVRVTPIATLPPPAPRFDAHRLRRRRFRVILYFTQVALHFLWWDCFLKQPVLRAFRTPWVPRWERLTERYKVLALDLQGLWVKLGQFLSTRVDILPLPITQQLDSLRDEVPPVSMEAIVSQIEGDFRRPVASVFSWLSPRPIGSASLAQVHRARTADGDSVVVKVLRPGVREIIAADLKQLREVARLLRWIGPIARRVDLNALVNEFDAVTTRELDLRLEGRNSERFAQDFANDPGVAVPRIYWEQSSINTLTMEDVSYIPIADIPALERAGIDPKAVARKVYNVYLRQFFVTFRIHADPHPGNLFIRPLSFPEEIADHPPYWRGYGPGDRVPYLPNRPFQLVIVDFGMTVELPARMREGLREFAIGLGTHDARRIIDAYTKVGVLQPGADLDRTEEMIRAQLDELWGTFIGQVREKDLTGPQAQAFFDKYKTMIASTPFQFQTEMLFMSRAMGILSGITSKLDPEFDARRETTPFALQLIREDVTSALRRSVEDLVAGRVPTSLGALLRYLPVPPMRSRPSDAPVAAGRPARSDEVVNLRKRVRRLTAAVAAVCLLAVGVALQSRGVTVSELAALWPGRNLGLWIIELSVISLIGILLRRS